MSLLIPNGSTVVIGLSGGPDSVYLLYNLAKQHHAGELQLVAAHLNHEWRSDSQNDVEFCQELCERSNIKLITKNASSLKFERKKHESLETYGRNLRRAFLEQTAREHTADLIALAHHADDQTETFFIRLIRGSSLAGLTCMREREGIYIRPLLTVTKQEIITYLDTHSIKYLEDPSNRSDDFLRNRIRNKVVPELKQVDERFSANVLKTIDRLQEAERYLDNLTKKTYHQVTDQESGTHALNCKSFMLLEPFMQKRIVLYWLIEQNVPFTPTEGLLDEIIRFLVSPRGGSHELSALWRINKKQPIASIRHASKIDS